VCVWEYGEEEEEGEGDLYWEKKMHFTIFSCTVVLNLDVYHQLSHQSRFSKNNWAHWISPNVPKCILLGTQFRTGRCTKALCKSIINYCF
jgi:hypothetical protein